MESDALAAFFGCLFKGPTFTSAVVVVTVLAATTDLVILSAIV